MATHAISLTDIRFRWPGNDNDTLNIREFQMETAEQVFLRGPSGSGKSTLLSLLAGITHPDQGEINLLATPLTQLKGSARDKFRADHIGYVFQMFNLLPYLSLLENVMLPCHFSEKRKASALSHSASLEDEAKRLLSHLKLPLSVLNKPVVELSIGQQQRVAVARALIGSPEIIIADEPTSALDADSRDAFIKLLFEECQQANSTLLFVSHDASLASHFPRHLDLSCINTAKGASHDFT